MNVSRGLGRAGKFYAYLQRMALRDWLVFHAHDVTACPLCGCSVVRKPLGGYVCTYVDCNWESQP